MGEVVEAIQDDIEIVLCEKVSKHRNQPDAEEGRVWRIFTVHLQTLLSGEKTIETSVFAVFFLLHHGLGCDVRKLTCLSRVRLVLRMRCELRLLKALGQISGGAHRTISFVIARCDHGSTPLSESKHDDPWSRCVPIADMYQILDNFETAPMFFLFGWHGPAAHAFCNGSDGHVPQILTSSTLRNWVCSLYRSTSSK